MRDWQSQAHFKYYCKYHVVFAPKYRNKSMVTIQHHRPRSVYLAMNIGHERWLFALKQHPLCLRLVDR